ncbi:MAG: hypothetical protein ACK5Y2_02730 [Bdellovibrionales bacterium]
MKVQSRFTRVRLWLLFSFVLFLSACGSSTSGPSETVLQSSSNGNPNPTKPIAYCNEAMTPNLSYRILAQSLNGVPDPSWVQMRILGLPAGFENSTTFLQFWKGQATTDTTVTFHPTPVVFSLFDTQSQTYIRNNISALRWSEVQTLIAGASPAAFFSRVILVMNLQDTTGQFQVLNATSYLTASNQAQERLDALLPTFFANPQDYAFKSTGAPRESVLRNLHPLRTATADFANLAAALCQ